MNIQNRTSGTLRTIQTYDGWKIKHYLYKIANVYPAKN